MGEISTLRISKSATNEPERQIVTLKKAADEYESFLTYRPVKEEDPTAKVIDTPSYIDPGTIVHPVVLPIALRIEPDASVDQHIDDWDETNILSSSDGGKSDTFIRISSILLGFSTLFTLLTTLKMVNIHPAVGAVWLFGSLGLWISSLVNSLERKGQCIFISRLVSKLCL